jgi:uncharacterized protein (DUF924 family)
LGTLDVHARAREVLDFWFGQVGEEGWFAKSDVLDAECAHRFGPLRDLVLGNSAAGWRDDSDTLLAAIILLDQFSRNIHRGEAEAFAADPLARALALEAIEKGWDKPLPSERRAFIYLPLEHAEDMAMQKLSVEMFATLEDEEDLKYARDHAAVIERFGRFPSRNAALGRESTPEELAYLSQPGAGW